MSIVHSFEVTRPRVVSTASLRIALALAVFLLARPCHGQDIEPRRWSHLPAGSNFAGVAYAYTSGDILLDPTLRIENAEFDLQTIAGKYIRSFALFGLSARVDLTQAYQFGGWTGLLSECHEAHSHSWLRQQRGTTRAPYPSHRTTAE